MSYWSDEAVQKRAAEAEEMRLQWKFRSVTTSQLEMRLENMAMSKQGQKDIELELVRRGATYTKRSYYDRPTKFFGSDGSSLSISTVGERPIYDWDNIIAAESAYIDEVLAKPIPTVSSVDMGKFLDSQTAMIRRVVPGLISMDSISGVQPMAKHVDMLPFFKAMKTKPFEEYTLTKADIDNVIAADKDLQPLKSRYYDTQSIGRGLREPSHFSDVRIVDYLNLLRTNEMSKTNVGLTALMDRIKTSGATQESFFDTESTFDTSSWFARHKADTDKYIEDALSRPNRFIMNDDIKYMYPADINLCCEESSTPIQRGTEITSFNPEFASGLWDTYLSAMKKATRELYGVKVGSKPAIITAKAPDFTSSVMMDCASGIEPIRGPRMQDFFVGEMKAYQPDVMIHATTPVEESPTFEMKVLKNRECGVGTVMVEFDGAKVSKWAQWATLAESTELSDPEDTRVSETLALLGIGEPQ